MFHSICFFCFFSLCILEGSFGNVRNNDLVIYAPGNSTSSRIDKIVNGTLELTCKILKRNVSVPISLDWKLPDHNKIRPNTSRIDDGIKLTIAQLHENDSGEYVCAGNVNEGDTKSLLPIQLNVRQRNIDHCRDHHFECTPGICIPERYRCDGLKDCNNGLDEDFAECGGDPCYNKLRCSDGRCIPKSWCCDFEVDSNCTLVIRHPCCPLPKHPGYPFSHGPHYNNQATLLQSTMYTVVGFAMVFMSIVTILMIAICRVHMQRSSCMLTNADGSTRRHHHSTPRSVYTASNPGRIVSSPASVRLVAPPYSSVEMLPPPPPYAPPPYYSDTPPPPYPSQDESSELSPCLPQHYENINEKMSCQESS